MSALPLRGGADKTSPPLHDTFQRDLPAARASAIWCADQLAPQTSATIATGWDSLNRELPGGGWPTRSLTEILQPQASVTELRLLAPALRAIALTGRDIVLVSPPKSPHVPGLRDEGIDEQRLVWIQAGAPSERLWATEQLVKSNAAGAVVAWLPQARPEQIRRLQICALSCDGPVFLCRQAAAVHEPSAAPLRVEVRLGRDWNLDVHVLKRRGAGHDGTLELRAVPAGLAPLITPRLESPSSLIAPPTRRKDTREHADAVGSPSPRAARARIPAH